MQVLAAGIPLSLLAGRGLAWLVRQWRWAMVLVALLALWTAGRGYFWHGLEERGFDGAYQVGFDGVAEILASSSRTDILLLMNEAHEPAVRWRLIERGDGPRYSLVDIKRFLRGETTTSERSALLAATSVYFASEEEATRANEAHPGILEGSGLGPYTIREVPTKR